MKTLNEIEKFCNDQAVKVQQQDNPLARQFIIIRDMAVSHQYQKAPVTLLIDSLEPDYKPESNRAKAERTVMDFINS